MMKWFQSNDEHRALQETTSIPVDPAVAISTTNSDRGRIDLLNLVDFDVQIAVIDDAGIQQFEVTDIVTAWMADSFAAQLSALGYKGPYADFDNVVLLEREDGSANGVANTGSNANPDVGVLYTAKYKGAALFTIQDNQLKVPPEVVESIQRTALINDVALLQSLQTAAATGLGASVIDVRAYINVEEAEPTAATDDGSAATDDGLELVIVIAIIVAAVAFVFLVFAIFWAWRYEKTNRDAYLVNGFGKGSSGPDKTGSDNSSLLERQAQLKLQKERSPVQEVDVGAQNDAVSAATFAGQSNRYSESVISEDISSSLSHYYRSGMGSSRYGNNSNSGSNNHLNDAASISSMESYGYSLDGYAPSMATPLPSDIMGAKERSIGLGQDEVEDESADELTLDHDHE